MSYFRHLVCLQLESRVEAVYQVVLGVQESQLLPGTVLINSLMNGLKLQASNDMDSEYVGYKLE